MIKGDLKQATFNIKEAISHVSEFHFYDLYHLCFLLEKCSFLSKIPSFVGKLYDSINQDQHPSVIRSQEHMINGLEERLHLSQQRLSEIRKQIVLMKSNGNLTRNTHLEHYLGIHDILPNSKKTCLSIIKLSSLLSAPYEGKYDIREKLSQCNNVVTNLHTRDELNLMNYNQTL